MSGAWSPATADTLVRMANQIAAFFSTQPGGRVPADIAEHLRLSCAPPMRAALIAHLHSGGARLRPEALQSVILLDAAADRIDPPQCAAPGAAQPSPQAKEPAMSYPSILVHAEADPKCGPRLRLAADLANQLGGILIGVGAETFDVDGFASSYADIDGSLVIAETKAVQEDLKIAEGRFRDVARTVDAGSEWRCATTLPGEIIARECRAADLIITGPRRREPMGLHNRADPGDLLMHAGRPILITPLEMDTLDASSIVVAWKDTREARRAVADALPLLQRARQVLVVEVCEARDEADARFGVADVAAWLDRHEVKASTAVHVRGEGVSVADALYAIADMQEAGVIVAGGFGHSRLREWVFGGVTQELLWRGAKAIFLSH